MRLKRKRYVCVTCGQAFFEKNSLKQHLLIHSEEKPLECSVGEIAFSDKVDLRRHSIRTKGKLYTCDVCGRAFSVKDRLKVHLLIHTKEKPYSCDVCGKAFAQKGNLKTHSFIHNKVKPYSCDVCEKAFSQKGNLRKHMLMHSKKKPQACDV